MGYINEKEIYKLFQETPGIARLHVAQIDELPRADVVEVKHGEWKSGTLGGHHGWYCSVCGSGYQGVEAQWIAKSHDYCGKCGAKMDGGEK